MSWQLFKGIVLISLVFCGFSASLPYTGLLFFMSLAVSTLLVVRTFYPALVRVGVASGMAIVINIVVWFLFHSLVENIQLIGSLTFIIIVVLFIALAPRMARILPASYSNAAHPTSYSYYQNGMLSIDLYHGTPDLNNVRDIIDYGSGFIVGRGNSYGTGVYFTNDFEEAKQYAKDMGGIVRVNLQATGDQIINYSAVVNSRDFQSWCSSSGNGSGGDNITDYTIGILRKRFIRVDPYNVYIALARVTMGNERVAFEGLTILGGFDTQGNPI
jgi:hypothetical protein